MGISSNSGVSLALTLLRPHLLSWNLKEFELGTIPFDVCRRLARDLLYAMSVSGLLLHSNPPASSTGYFTQDPTATASHLSEGECLRLALNLTCDCFFALNKAKRAERDFRRTRTLASCD